ncbi:PGPGW domain-containing protein [Nocardiopsis akebiae]|uniref:PGPGW domain-containing protein n=1 Tax=Nocardiopsis akebiae TaxID=2831968 RepID=A0ABX8CB81_9ACTN|nr:PGPGW domain-containing protein [Nocardiopsis akebiae]QUX31682.1 PGPGW domain-containing protein [Nocardiopsis akebiae]
MRARLRLFRRRMHTHPALRLPWSVLVGTVGVVVVLAGLVMMVVPGPGLASVVLGLVILSTEFRWAQKVVRPAQVWFRRAERYGMRLKEEFFRRLRARRAVRRGRPLPDTPSD